MTPGLVSLKAPFVSLAKKSKVYKGTSDIYTYFYELGFNVLKIGGGY
nr:hypothetical protein [Campylobacter coli]